MDFFGIKEKYIQIKFWCLTPIRKYRNIDLITDIVHLTCTVTLLVLLFLIDIKMP